MAGAASGRRKVRFQERGVQLLGERRPGRGQEW